MPSHTVTLFATRLRAAREAAGYSQRGLGIALGLDVDSASPRINHYERGRREPGLEMAARIAAMLEVPLAYLYCAEDDLAEALLTLARLDRPARKRVIDAMKQEGSGRQSGSDK